MSRKQEEGSGSLEQVRWLVKAGEFPEEQASNLLEGVLDLLADVSPRLMRKARVTWGKGPSGAGSVT